MITFRITVTYNDIEYFDIYVSICSCEIVENTMVII